LENLARLLVFFHSRPVPAHPLSPDPALAYFDKVIGQLHAAGLLNREDCQALTDEGEFWEMRFQEFSDQQVLVHGDATPPIFLMAERWPWI
jgi:hypothetical protein